MKLQAMIIRLILLSMMTVSGIQARIVPSSIAENAESATDDSSQSTIVITSQPPTTAQTGHLYQYAVEVVTSPASQTVCFELHDGPSGMTMDASTGLIEWTPTTAGMFEVEVRARLCGGTITDDGGSSEAEQRFILSVFSGNAAAVSGIVTNDSGKGLGDIRIRLFDVASGEFVLRTTTDDSGKYIFPMVNPSVYFARASDEMGVYESQWFNGVQRLEDATPITVSESSSVVINFTLHRRPQSGDSVFALSGSVHSSDSNAPLRAKITATSVQDDRHADDDELFDRHDGSDDGENTTSGSDGHQGDDHLKNTSISTDSNGNYSLHLKKGSYILSAKSDGFQTQFWNGVTNALDANIIDLHQDSTGFDFVLHTRATGAGSISGTIRTFSDSLPLESHVSAFHVDSLAHMDGLVATGESDSLGHYSIGGLPAGNYVVLAFDHGHDIVPTFYSVSGGTPFLDSASTVLVSTGPVTGIDIFVQVDSVDGLNEVKGEVETELEVDGKPGTGRRSPESLSPLGGTIVIVKNTSSGSIVGSTVSFQDGSYRIPGITAGSFSVVFQKPGMKTTSVPARISYINNLPSSVIVNAQIAGSSSSSSATGILSLNSKWNLLSLPVSTADAQAAALFPTAISGAFSFAGTSGYQQSSTLRSGSAYWMKFGSPLSVALLGSPLTNLVINVQQGWNMIGTIAVPVSAAAIQPSAGVSLASFFGYDGGYTIAGTLEPGKGYWVKSSANGTIMLSSTAAAAKQADVNSMLQQLNSITIGDGVQSQRLLFGKENGILQASNFEMPPAGPGAEIFDARFASNTLVEFHPGQIHGSITLPVIVRSASKGLTISWSIQSPDASYTLSDGIRSVNLAKGSGSVKLQTTSSVTELTLVVTSQALPKEFSLEQNYPNPFNPTTNFQFQIADAGVVSLKIYDVLGREVQTIVNESMQAGSYTRTWDATNVASGVYYYRLEVRNAADPKNNFTQVRKMILMK